MIYFLFRKWLFDIVNDLRARARRCILSPDNKDAPVNDVTLIDGTAALEGAASLAFQRAHTVLIAAKPRDVFDYVTNPKSWPEWLPSSHHIDCDDRPMRFGDTFHEHWSTRTGPVHLDWLVIACEPPRLWIGLTQTPFMGPIVVQYDCVPQDGGTLFTRTMRNPARPKMPTSEMIVRMDEEAAFGLANIGRVVESRAASHRDTLSTSRGA